MARQVRQILGLLGAAQASAVQVYPLGGDEDEVDADVAARVAAWSSVWGADFGRVTAAVTPAEKDALIAAGATELARRG